MENPITATKIELDIELPLLKLRYIEPADSMKPTSPPTTMDRSEVCCAGVSFCRAAVENLNESSVLPARFSSSMFPPSSYSFVPRDHTSACKSFNL